MARPNSHRYWYALMIEILLSHRIHPSGEGLWNRAIPTLRTAIQRQPRPDLAESHFLHSFIRRPADANAQLVPSINAAAARLVWPERWAAALPRAQSGAPEGPRRAAHQRPPALGEPRSRHERSGERRAGFGGADTYLNSVRSVNEEEAAFACCIRGCSKKFEVSCEKCAPVAATSDEARMKLERFGRS